LKGGSERRWKWFDKTRRVGVSERGIFKTDENCNNTSRSRKKQKRLGGKPDCQSGVPIQGLLKKKTPPCQTNATRNTEKRTKL